ncbi:MAG: hypothetical protein H7312_14145 [Tardiphaga sp.]|jgi:hypothetical protein|nr:hypothetical protein [Tardiphaga sp.]
MKRMGLGLLAIASAGLLASCISTPVNSNIAPGVLTQNARNCGKYASGPSSYAAYASADLSPYMYLRYGFSEVKGLCRAFFDGITEENRKARFSRRALDSSALFATAALNATFASAKAISLTSAGIILADSIIQDFVEVYAFSPYASQVEGLTKQAMDDYEKTTITGSVGWQADAARSQDNYCLADIFIKDFASLCSLSAIQAKMDGLANRPADAVPKTKETVIVTGAARFAPAVAPVPNLVINTPVPGAINATPLPTTNYEIK